MSVLDSLSLENRTAVVVGGTSGIGLAIAKGFADAGADVIPTSRREEQVDQAAAEIEAFGRRSLRMTSDVLDRESLVAVREKTLETFGKIDIMLCAAGRTKRGPTINFPEKDWTAIVETNLTGTLHACQVFAEPMFEAGYGRIINIASLTTYLGFYEVAAYGASKAAVGSLTKTLATEWAPNGVNVNAIAPGVFRTDLNAKLLDSTDRGKELLMRTPMKRWGKVEELVGAAVFLASEASSFVAGEIIAVDGGFLASGVNS